MTHYDPRDWEPPEPEDRTHKALMLIGVILCSVIIYSVFPQPASAADFVIVDQDGAPLLDCDSVEYLPAQRGFVCRVSYQVFRDGME